ncbi:hypothetical protein B0I35DRAFT_439535 [Stachybotrys elegans]|uniref:6-phosphogluconate dehydrogenase NADP-binding domain-containing protein n=1 Tax=Stachybotrys elegans TaxID=80388 RepID=A0A8K0WNM6_9HYPO|nr:hypothetical protein B0I35DRAFT_439535 [Stachybotrys elegans]
MSPSRVTCIGIGNMGSALAKTLLKANVAVTLWNRTRDRAQVDSAISAGGEFVSDITEAVARNDIIIICLFDYNTLNQAFAPLENIKSALLNKRVVNLTNGTPSQAREAERWMKARGAAEYYDGGVMVTPELVGTPHSFLVYSGENEGSWSAESGLANTLKPLGQALYIAPDAGAAAVFDLAALSAMYGMFSGAFMGMGLIKKQGGKVLPGVEKVMAPLLGALVPYLGLIAKSIDEETWDDNLGNPLGMQLAGVRNILQACKEEGVDGTGLEHLARLMEEVVKERGGDGGIAAVGQRVLQ